MGRLKSGVADGEDVGGSFETRPDTRPPVADGWTGVDMRIFPLFDLC